MAPRTRSYNERLFAPGLYGWHHQARFNWLREHIEGLGLESASVLELGCFDGRSIRYVPVEIRRYVGLDAGWESATIDGEAQGLEAARLRYKDRPQLSFRQSTDPSDILSLDDRFDIGICLETFEHIDPEKVETYVAALAGKLNGTLFITVPNEKQLPLLVKIMGRKLLGVRYDSYTLPELWNAARGRMDRVRRLDHRGFDYAKLVKQLERSFQSVEIEGVPFRWLPPQLQFTVGIIARRPRRAARAA